MELIFSWKLVPEDSWLVDDVSTISNSSYYLRKFKISLYLTTFSYFSPLKKLRKRRESSLSLLSCRSLHVRLPLKPLKHLLYRLRGNHLFQSLLWRKLRNLKRKEKEIWFGIIFAVLYVYYLLKCSAFFLIEKTYLQLNPG